MKYNEKYDRWVSKNGLVYRYSKRQDKLFLCKEQEHRNNYLYIKVVKPKSTVIRIHRLVYETFNGEIPVGYEIDHIDGNKQNNALSNLRCVTHTENMANPITRSRLCKPRKIKGRYRLGKPISDFGKKFKEHFGINMCDNEPLYKYHYNWYSKHNKVCKWEKEE